MLYSQVFECAWDGCDYQFEDQDDLLTHVNETSGHLQAQRKCRNLYTNPISRISKSHLVAITGVLLLRSPKMVYTLGANLI